jgi:hypothetical protein
MPSQLSRLARMRSAGNHLTEVGARTLAEGLLRNGPCNGPRNGTHNGTRRLGLTRLDLSGNALRCAGVSALADALAGHRGLVDLRLDACKVPNPSREKRDT